jgi:hypothetical protein
MRVGGQRHAPAALPPGKTRYPLHRRLGGSGRVPKILSPPGSPDRPTRSESLYRLTYPGPKSWHYWRSFITDTVHRKVSRLVSFGTEYKNRGFSVLGPASGRRTDIQTDVRSFHTRCSLLLRQIMPQNWQVFPLKAAVLPYWSAPQIRAPMRWKPTANSRTVWPSDNLHMPRRSRYGQCPTQKLEPMIPRATISE